MFQAINLKFYLTEKQKHGDQLLYDWLLDQAKALGVPGATVFRPIAGYGRHGSLHAETFIELGGELPILVEFILDERLAEELLATVHAFKLNIRYVHHPVTSGMV